MIYSQHVDYQIYPKKFDQLRFLGSKKVTHSFKFHSKSGTTPNILVPKVDCLQIFSSKYWLTLHFLVPTITWNLQFVPIFSLIHHKINSHTTMIRINLPKTYANVVWNDRVPLKFCLPKRIKATNERLNFSSQLQIDIYLNIRNNTSFQRVDYQLKNIILPWVVLLFHLLDYSHFLSTSINLSY